MATSGLHQMRLNITAKCCVGANSVLDCPAVCIKIQPRKLVSSALQIATGRAGILQQSVPWIRIRPRSSIASCELSLAIFKQDVVQHTPAQGQEEACSPSVRIRIVGSLARSCPRFYYSHVLRDTLPYTLTYIFTPSLVHEQVSPDIWSPLQSLTLDLKGAHICLNITPYNMVLLTVEAHTLLCSRA